jgi:hypothetical protein
VEYRPFGQTGIDISAIGFGCWEIGGGYGSIEETEFLKAVNRALDVGLNSFDTAEAYRVGASEKSLAKALGSRRKEAVITTKFGVGYPDKPNYRDSSRQRVMESIEKSLKAGAHLPLLSKVEHVASLRAHRARWVGNLTALDVQELSWKHVWRTARSTPTARFHRQWRRRAADNHGDKKVRRLPVLSQNLNPYILVMQPPQN